MVSESAAIEAKERAHVLGSQVIGHTLGLEDGRCDTRTGAMGFR
jgi:hypothetical protein